MRVKSIFQYCVPQHLLSRLMGAIANCRRRWVKQMLITWFCNRYGVDLTEAVEENRENYSSFNDFFTRALKPTARPIATDKTAVISPVDGCISQYGTLNAGVMIQAKGIEFNLEQLLGRQFSATYPDLLDGEFATLYLSPADYHRIHMPIAGRLQHAAYIPGRLFSVAPYVIEDVVGLYTKNERLIAIFNTAIGPLIMVFVGAMLVAGIETVWQGRITPNRYKKVQSWNHQNQDINFQRGEEIARFQFGSTVIMLLPQHSIKWDDHLRIEDKIKMGTGIAVLK